MPCNEGRRHRDVTCINDEQTELEESECAGKTKPANQEICDMGPCISNWFVSEWNDLVSFGFGFGFFQFKTHILFPYFMKI